MPSSAEFSDVLSGLLEANMSTSTDEVLCGSTGFKPIDGLYEASYDSGVALTILDRSLS